MSATIIGLMNVTLGEAIAIERKRQGMSQAQLAEKCGISRNSLVLIENGYLGTPISILQKIAEALGFELRVDLLPKHDRIECARHSPTSATNATNSSEERSDGTKGTDR